MGTPSRPPSRAGDATARRPAARRGRRRLALLAACPLAGVVLAEAALRLSGPAPRPPNPPGLFVADALAGFRLAPDFSGQLLGGDEPVAIRTNAHGFRDDELPPRATGARRILLLGDSQGFGHGVPVEHTFARLLEELPGPAGRRMELVNASVPGHGTWNELGMLEASFADVQPDTVLLALYVGNDFRDNLPEAFGRIRAHSGVLVNVPPGGSERLAVLKAAVGVHSRLAPLLYLALVGGDQDGAAPAPARRRAFCDDLAWSPEFGCAMLRTRWDEVAQRAFDGTCRALQAVRDACAARGVALHLALLPGPCQYSDPYWEALVAHCALEARDFDRARPNRELAAWAATHDVPVLDLLPAFAAAQRARPDVPLSMDVHLSVAGHRVAAEALAAFLGR